MARLYTRRQTNEILKELQIKAVENKVTSQEAARLLTWRAKHEYNKDHPYTDTAVRRHVTLGNLKDITHVSDRQSLYSVDEIFLLPLKPRQKAPLS